MHSSETNSASPGPGDFVVGEWDVAAGEVGRAAAAVVSGANVAVVTLAWEKRAVTFHIDASR